MRQTLVNRDWLKNAVFWMISFLTCLSGTAAWSQAVVLKLKSGDRIAGTILSENTNTLVISNAWANALAIPLAAIAKRETNSVVPLALHPPTPRPPAKEAKNTSQKLVAKAGTQPPVKLPPKPKGTWHGQVRIGLNAILERGDQQNYFGNLKLTYARPYESNPKKFFRNTTQIDAQYQRTDGQESANRAQASNKSDFDIGEHYYAYGLGSAGYDEVRKIDFQYQLGPGMGGHLFQLKNFVLNVESGLNYQAQYRRDIADLETLYLRIGANSTWSIVKNLKLTQDWAFYPDLENKGQYHNEYTSTLSYGFWQNLSLNLTLLDDYNTAVAPGVDENRFELRSSLGLTF